MATASGFWQGFRHWRRRRPFWGGLLLLLSGVELFFSANLSLGDMEVHVGPQGFLSYLLPLMLLLCGFLCWFTPAQRLFYGVLGLLTALYSLVGLNFGGFVVGMFLGLFGGAMVLAWAPRRGQPEAAAPVAAEPTPAEPDSFGGSPGERYGANADAPTEFLPGFSGPAAPGPRDGEGPPPSGGVHRKAFVIGLVPLVVTAAVLFGGGHTPARAATCPEGLPSRSSTASETATTTATTSSATSAAKKAAAKTSAAAAKTSATPSTSASAEAETVAEDDGSSIIDDIQDGVTTIIDGVGDLLGIGDDATPAPTETPSPAESSATPSPTPSTSTSAPADDPAPSSSAEPSGSSSPSGSASPSSTPTSTEIPCLGARVQGLVASADDVPFVTAKGATLETDSLTMYDSTYDGVVTLNTADGGTLKALKFSMSKAVNKPFTLTIPESDGHTTLIKSAELTTKGNVKFYTPKFEAKLFGVIPVTFTPEQPPPLTLPVLWFTDVTINLTFVRCDTLTAKPMDISEK